MGRYDIAYKEFFSEPQNVEDLLRYFVKKDFVKELDFSTLKRLNAGHILKEGGERHDDMIWCVRWKNQWLYIYIILEFQSSVDYTMPVRIMSYVAELWLGLLNNANTEFHKARRVPPVLPIVLYNGIDRWNAPTNVADMLCGNNFCNISLDYYLIDELHPGKGTKDAVDNGILNCVTALFEVERTKNGENLNSVLQKLSKKLRTKEELEKFATFLRFMRRFLKIRFRTEVPREFTDFEEIITMTRDFAEIERAAGRAEGMAAGRAVGREEGKEEGREEGGLKMLINLVDKNLLTIKQAAEELGMSVAKFKSAARKLAGE